MYYQLFILVIICLWIFTRFYSLSNIEFAILLILLTFILCNCMDKTEFFYDDFSFNKLYEIPKYIETSIGDGLDKIIKASQPNTGGSNNNYENDMAFLTPELFLSDSTLTTNDKIDPVKYNVLINDYLNFESIFNVLLEKYPNKYVEIFT